jgi:GDP-mannose 6-dehydrogenase
MDVSIFGLGYVGCVTAGCLTDGGHTVTGVDINPQKVEQVNEGVPPVDEPGLADLFEDAAADGRLGATTDAGEAAAGTDISFVSVNTPLDETGKLSTTSLYNVMDSIVPAIEDKGEHTVVIRSTVPAGTTASLRNYLNGQLDEATANFVVNPEFLREGTALTDFYDPPYVVIGEFAGDDASAVHELYDAFEIDASTEIVEPQLAESVKMVNNAFHALKICFANEVSSVAAAEEIDGKRLMELVCADGKLNISPAYLTPGFAFGGSCLPKDSRSMATLGSEIPAGTPLLGSITESNDSHLQRIAAAVDGLPGERVGIAGVSFKSGTDDMRNSPGLRLARLLDETPLLYSRSISPANAVGSNRDYLEKTFPDLESFLVNDPEEFLDRVDCVVFTNTREYDEFVPGIEGKSVCDPVGTMADHASEIERYERAIW